MKVYVLMGTVEHEFDEVLGVYATPEGALAEREERLGRRPRRYDHIEVEEHEVLP